MSNNYIEYVAGFLFSRDRLSTLLILKDKPAWQHGKLNAVGGHVEDSESSLMAMHREFLEETELYIYPEDWKEFVTFTNHKNKGIVHFYACYSPLADLKSYLEEEVLTRSTEPIVPIDIVNINVYNAIPNLQWLIPLALDRSLKFPIQIEDTREQL